MSEVFTYSDTRLATRLVLLALADAAGDTHRMCWESVDTIAGKARVSRRKAFEALHDLAAQCVIEDVPDAEKPPEALRYASVVRRILPVSSWNSKPGGAEFAPPLPPAVLPEGGAESARGGAEFSPNPSYLTRSNREIEETTSLLGAHRASEGLTTRPGAKGWEAVAAPKRGGRRKTRKQEAAEREQAERELDPAYVISQSLDENDPGTSLGDDLPAADVEQAPAVQRGRKPRSKRPCERLAEYFDREARRVGSNVPGATNKAALGRNLQRWMDEGTDYATVSRMITQYWSESWKRSDVDPAWKDFQNQRGLLTQRLGKQAKANQSEGDRYNEGAW